MGRMANLHLFRKPTFVQYRTGESLYRFGAGRFDGIIKGFQECF